MAQEMLYDIVSAGIDVKSPLIYLWEVRDSSGTIVARYVGKAKNGDKRPRNHYKRNVDKLLKELPYREGNPNGFRRVHRALAAATRAGHSILLTYLRNVLSHEDINRVEMDYIRDFGCLAKDGIGMNGRSRTHQPPVIAFAAHTPPATLEVFSNTLNQIKDFIEQNYTQLHTEKISHGFSFYLGKNRILRFSQSSPKAKIRLKLAISSRHLARLIEMAWTGGEIELKRVIDNELRLHTEHYASIA